MNCFIKKFLSLFTCFVLWGCGASPIADDRVETSNIVFLGASITAGYKVEKSESYVGLLTSKIADLNPHYIVINQSVSGDTSADGLARLASVLEADPEIVVLALGGNDFLKRKSLESVEKNLSTIIESLQAENRGVLLVGVMAPPTGGLGYTREAKRMYERLSETYNVPLMPNYLKGLALDQRYMMSDRIHPNVLGHSKLADNMWPYLEPLLRQPQ